VNPGEIRKVTFILTPKDLSFYNVEMARVVEPGSFKVWVGKSSADGLEAGFKIVDS
jgi:beta-glucosidase